jgi:hypothetical protein
MNQMLELDKSYAIVFVRKSFSLFPSELCAYLFWLLTFMRTIKFTTMPKPPKKLVGVKYKRTPGAVVQKGKPSSVVQTVTRGAVTKTYTPDKAETGQKEYGKAGGGTDPEMRRLISEAQAKKRDVTEYGTKGRTKGLHYKAGTTTTSETPPSLNTTLNVHPTIRKVKDTITPIYKTETSTGGKLKARSLTLGGSDKKGGPGTFKAVGTYGGLRRRRPKK